MDIPNLPGLSGWPGLVISIIVIIVYGYWTNKSVKIKVDKATKDSQDLAEKIAKDAQKSAIDAMQLESQALRRRIDDIAKENARLEQTLTTIVTALEAKGMYVTIQGHMVTIREGKETTVSPIKEDKE